MHKKGRQLEHKLCRDIYQETNGDLLPEPIGYSGNHSIPAPDISIDDGTKVHAIELKDTKQDRKSIHHNPDDWSGDDLDQLLTYAREYPRTVVPYVGVKFSRRQLVLASLWLGAPNEKAVLRSATNTAPTDVRLTHANNLSFHRPSTNEWPSARAGNDVNYLLETIGYR